jgi:hypothetical protein
MTEKKEPLGVLRVAVIAGPFFDTPYYEGFNMGGALADVRAAGYWFNGVVYVPYSSIAFITQIPSSVLERMDAVAEATGATKQ